MAKLETNLTSRPAIARIKHPATETDFYSHQGDALKGLRLAVGTRSKSWIVSKRIGGKVRSIKLGNWPDIPNGDGAMDIARDKIAEVEAGTDAKATSIVTLHDAFESHVGQSDAQAATIATYRLQIKNHLCDLFSIPIEKVTLPMMEAAISGKGVSQASHLVQIIKMSFRRAATVRRCFDVSASLKVKGAKRYMPSNKVKFDAQEEWPALNLIFECNSLIHRTAWLVMLFTGFRSLNVRSMTWDQVDLTKKTILLTAMKNGLDRTFPISDVVIAALTGLPHREGYVFPADSMTGHIHQLDARTLGVEMFNGKERPKKALRQHDCRRLFSTAARRARLPEYIIDELRGDTPKSVQDIYDQGSANHDDANKIAKRICTECGITPDFVLDRIKGGA